MSVRTELEELAKWLSGLSEKEEPEPTPQPLPRETWQAIERNLQSASDTFAKASDALRSLDRGSILAEFARDLESEADALAFRAHLLARRAAPRTKPDGPKAKPVESKSEVVADREEVQGESTGTAKAGTPEDAAPSAAPADLVRSAGNTIEWAHLKLGTVEHPDAVAKAYEEELDVLAEMTLSLRQQCDRLEDDLTGAGMAG